MFIHDACAPNHEKDYHTWAAFPPERLADKDLVVWSQKRDGRLEIEVLQGAAGGGQGRWRGKGAHRVRVVVVRGAKAEHGVLIGGADHPHERYSDDDAAEESGE